MQPLKGTLKGMKDLLPQDFKAHEYVIQVAKDIGKLYGFEQMSTPILEFTEIFDRTLGDSSDIVSKEMYNFLDKGGRSVALRPEFTAAIVRACMSNKLFQHLPIKFFSTGAVFRYDNPQAGRYRQFHQINFEHIGAEGATTDAEMIKLATDILTSLQIDDFRLDINSLGCSESRNNYQTILIEYFQKYYNDLSEDSKKRLLKNPLRILDSKDEKDKLINESAPVITTSYTKEARKYFEEVLKCLDILDVKYTLNNKIVRGLDYYSHTAFEFIANNLGAQSTILAGGRYDNLSKIMGGPDAPAIGFAAGIERLLLVQQYEAKHSRSVMILPIGDDNIEYALKLASILRQQNITTELDIKGKVSKRMSRALDKDAAHIIFIGDDERLASNYKLKNLDKSQEQTVNLDKLIAELQLVTAG